MIERDEVTPGSTWRHIKAGSTYTVEGFTICSTNGEQNGVECVSYISHSKGIRHHRETSEFLDGRFVKESP